MEMVDFLIDSWKIDIVRYSVRASWCGFCVYEGVRCIRILKIRMFLFDKRSKGPLSGILN